MPKVKSVPSYRLHKARGCAVVTIDGRNRYLGAFNSPESLEAYARLIAEHFGTARQNKSALSSNASETAVTVTELCATYMNWASGYYVKNGRPTSQVDVIRMALRALRRLYGSTEAGAFGPLALDALQRSLVSDCRTRTYVNTVSAEVRRLFKWAARKELVSVTVCQALTTVPGLARGRTTARETAPVLPVDKITVEATLPFLPAVVADMVRLQSLIGCRPTEVCLIRPGDVDTTGDVWVYVPSEHKTEHHNLKRRIFIGSRAQDILRPYLLRPAEMHCFLPNAKRTDRGMFTKDSYNCAVSRAVKKANALQVKALTEALGRAPTEDEAKAVQIRKWSPNQLRHSVATEIRRQFGVEAAQVVLGHSRADVTQVYAERDWQKAADVMKSIG